MKTQLKIAVAVAVLSLAGIASAAEHADLGTAQRLGEQGFSPVDVQLTIPLDDSARPTSNQIGEAQQQAETGLGYTSKEKRTNVANEPGTVGQAPSFGIGEAQQIAQTGAGYTTESAAPRRDYASIRK